MGAKPRAGTGLPIQADIKALVLSTRVNSPAEGPEGHLSGMFKC
jgi:hypothetical protein